MSVLSQYQKVASSQKDLLRELADSAEFRELAVTQLAREVWSHQRHFDQVLRNAVIEGKTEELEEYRNAQGPRER